MDKYFDAHTHLTDSKFDSDRQEIIGRAKATGLMGLVTVGYDMASSRAAVELAHAHPGFVYATVGLHPKDGAADQFDPEEMLRLARDPGVVGIGECGLDLYKVKGQKLEVKSENEERVKEKQEELFIKHIELAKEVRKPLMIHCRQASSDLVRVLLATCPSLLSSPGIIHFYTDSLEDAKKLLDMGFYFSIGGVITFTRDYDDLVRLIPTDRLLSETDAPYVAPVPHRGERNEPAYVAEVVKKLAEVRGVSREEMAEMTFANAQKVFSIS